MPSTPRTRPSQSPRTASTTGNDDEAALAAVTVWPVNIGCAARLSGISPKMLRHYESMGLLGAVSRTGSNYRQYSLADVHTLRFIRRSRDMGFGLDAIAELVSLWHNRRRSSASVKRIAHKHLVELGERIEALQAMQRTLDHLLQLCPGNGRPDCPILDDWPTPEAPTLPAQSSTKVYTSETVVHTSDTPLAHTEAHPDRRPC